MNSTIGVLITYCDEKEMFTECINSLFSQTRLPDEVVVYDDSSEFPARDYIPNGCKVKLIRSEEKRGPGYGRNRLFEESKSEYVHFSDSDDLFTQRWCEKVAAAIKKSEADIIFTEISSYEDKKLVKESILGLKSIGDGDDPVRFALRGCILTGASTMRREVFLKVKGYRTREVLSQSEDFDFHVRVLALGISHAEILEPLIIKRLRPDSHSSKDLIETWASAVDSIDMLSREIPERYRLDLAEAAARVGSILYTLGAYSYSEEAYSLSIKLGPPRFLTRRWQFRILAGIFGPVAAEKARLLYTRLSAGLKR